MWGIGIDSLKWLMERFLQVKKESKEEKRKEWIRVADYFDQLASAIETALTSYKNGIRPHGIYAQLVEMKEHFPEVIAPIVNVDDDSYRKYLIAFESAIPIIRFDCNPIDVSFETYLSGIGDLLNEDPLILLERVAGQFRGLSISLRAKA